MKATLLIAASLLGTAALAQTTPDDSAPASTASTTSPDAAATAPSNAPSTGPAASDAASGMASNPQTVATDTSNYPACSRTVTDKCVQRGAWHKSRPHR